MGLSDELRSGVGPWWERVVTNRFVIELGDNTLDPQVFQTYFDQDYLFLKDWAILLSLASAKAPDFDACRQLVGFLHLGLGGEESLFQEAFRQRGMSGQDVANLSYRPTTLHYSGYLRNIAYSGDFTDIAATLLAVEWPYLDWAQRLEKAGKQPANHFYQTWIDLHTSQGMATFVGWLQSVIDQAEPVGRHPVPVAAHFRGRIAVRAPVLGNGLSGRPVAGVMTTPRARAMTIAGSDSGGGAGIQADLKTFAALGVYGASALTAITAQNTVGVTAVHEIPTDVITAQIDAVLDDIGADAVKTGMLSSSPIIECVSQAVQRHQVQRLVVDPVMVAKSGDSLLREDAIDSLRSLLLPLAAVVTPNIPEAEALTSRTITSPDDARVAAREIVNLGCRSVVVKGGHLDGPATDLFFDGICLP